MESGTTKDKVLALLMAHEGEWVSGAAAADELGLTRNAVWKAIGSLREEGCGIEAVTNRGYRLSGQADLLSGERIASLLRTKGGAPGEAETDGFPGADRIHIYTSLASTNRTAKEMAIAGAPHGTVVIADMQTGGSGHHARRFYSPRGGIYMSVILLPGAFPHTDTETVTACAAVSVCRAIETECGLHPGIRPVNDLFIEGKKVCGILTESMTDCESCETQWIVTGIGINLSLREEQIPEELRGIAGSLYPDGMPPVTRNRLIASVLRELLGKSAASERDEILAAYRERKL